MKLRDVLRKVLYKLDIEKEVPIDVKMVGGDTIKKLMVASNNIIREIASSYLPLLARECVTVEDNRLSYDILGRRPIKIVALRCGNDSMRYKMYPSYMYAENGEYEIEYSYLPREARIDDEIEADVRVTEEMLANGIASEYALMIGKVDIANIYDKKYRENLKNICVTSKEIRVKGRAFI